MKYILILTFSILGHQDPQQKLKRWEDDLPKDIVHYYLWPNNNDYRYAFFTFNKKRDYNIFNSSYKASALSNVELKTIEKLIAEKVEIYNKRTKGELIKQPKRYYKQLIAVLNSKGEKEVWVNCSCEALLGYWKKEIVLVEGGGSCCFNLKVNLTKSIVYNFMVNGPK